MIGRLLALLRPLRRQRFRDRVLLGMLVVAVVPLVAFTAIVAADLGAVSNSTVDETHRTILQDQEQRQQSQVGDRAQVIDERLASIAGEVRQLRDQTTAVLGGQPPQVKIAFRNDHGAWYSTASDADTSVIVGQTSHLIHGGIVDNSDHTAAIASPSAPLVPFMEGMHRNYSEIEAVWIVDKADQMIRTVPSIDVPGAIDGKRLDPDQPLGPSGDTIFSTSQARFAAAAGEPQAWSDPAKPGGAPTDGPFWTDPYSTRAGDQGVTVWMPVGKDGRYLVGADIAVSELTTSLLQPVISGEPGAYPLLLSSNNRVLAAAEQAQKDFGLTGHVVGTLLPLRTGTEFGDGLLAVEQSGHPAKLRAKLAGVDRELFPAPIYSAHWVLATSVPVTDLEPDVRGLTRGIQSGIHRILVAVIPIAAVLIVLAFLLATLLARRLVGPVRELQLSAERLARGRTDVPVPPQGTDEVGMLAASLERMRREINASRDAILAAARELEGRVAERTHELRTRNEELVALNVLAGALTRALDSESILAGALDTARAVLPAIAGRGYVAGDAGGLEERTRWRTGDSGDDAVPDDALLSVARAALRSAEVTVEWGEHPTDPVLVALPFQAGKADLGALAVSCQPGTHLAERTRTLLSAVSDQVALALRTLQLAAEGRELAVLEERTRLAREIHDTLAQQLTAIVLQLEAAEAFVERNPGRVGSVVVTARDLARSALQEARRSVWNLRPATLEATGLVAALEREVRRWRQQSGVPARLHAEGLPNPLPLSPAAEVALFRIVQEALTNVAHHSQARRVDVTVARHGGALEISVVDDGVGFELETAPQRGSFGLVGMGERARLAGGSLEVTSRPGDGTSVVVRLPLGEPVVPAAVPA